MSDERLRAALEAVLPWVDFYDDSMVGDDFAKREAAERFARAVLAGDESVTLESARADIERERRERAAKGPRLVIGP